jgi:SNF2 family DNA or RNA helicase
MPKGRPTEKELESGRKLLSAKKVKSLIFSEGTYQSEIEVVKGDVLFPFLQISDEGELKDGFCSCSEDSSSTICSHLAATYVQIMGEENIPLHVRFRDSFWNQLAQMASRRHGYDTECLEGRGEYKALSSTGKLLFQIKPKTPATKKKLLEIIVSRPIETEETSLKFFNLPEEELALWKSGTPSHNLRYELSFWADLAKWWMLLAQQKEPYSIVFSDEDKDLPRWVEIHFPQVEVGFYIARANWLSIIPSLKTVHSPLKVEEEGDSGIKGMTYDRKGRSFSIQLTEKPKGPTPAEEKGIEIEGYMYISSVGFFPIKRDPFFSQGIVHEDRIASVLHKYRTICRKYLTEDKVHEGSYPIRYDLHFDQNKSLHISSYLFEPGDLQKKDSSYFTSWVYIENKGFYEVENTLFSAVDTVIARDRVGDFVNKHRIWLNSIDGFQTHLMTIESQLEYFVDQQMSLCFESHFELVDDRGGILDFGEWVYISGKGFFQKEKEKGGMTIYSGLKIPKGEVSLFIRKNTAELKHVTGFFAAHCPVDSVLIDILLTPDESIRIKPHYTYGMKVDPSRVFFFSEYAFVDKEGFSLMPVQLPMESFLEEKILEKKQENYFILNELDALAPFIRLWDPRLKKTKQIHLRITEVQKDEKAKEGKWIVDLDYETDVGRVDAVELWKGLQENKKHLFTTAGLIDLRQPRFNWLKSLSKKRWLKNGKQLRLSSLEWIRLNAFEDLIEPQGDAPKEEKSRSLLEEFRQMQSVDTLSIEGLKSELRLYQETGLKWLWFLYCNGLSGLLCDEMGLGKTHQAMALLAAVSNTEGENKKYLVVCPTSVIYHWEDLLAKFLPHIRVSVFYGLGRKLSSFAENYDLLLTSYGTLRSERKELSKIDFEVAVFDEIQNAKNMQSQTHKSLRSMKCRMVVGLTGTPLENRLLDLKALFEIILPGYLPMEAQFKEFFSNAIEKGHDEEKRELLSKIIKPFILRRKKTEVLLELPEKIEEIYYCDLSDEQKKLYKEVFYTQKDSLLKELSDKTSSKGYVHIFSVLSKLKQICNHPAMINKDYDNFLKYRSGKWDLFVERLEEARESGQKVVVFSQYLDMMDMIEKYLSLNNIGFAEIRGSTKKRREEIERFKNDPACEVFVASLQAAGSGIELTSASVVIHYDRWWNPAKENQATDRVHRIGQSRGVQVFKLVTKKSVEERIHELIEKKSKLFESVVGFDEQDQIKSLSRQELIELVKTLEKDIEVDPYEK